MKIGNAHQLDAPQAPSPRLVNWFGVYLRRYLRRHFHAIRIANSGALARHRGPLIVYINHASWWDPLTCMLLARTVFPAHQHYGPMDAEALARYPLLQRLGLFPVERGTPRGAAQFLRASTSILRRKNTVLWLTPQGAFCDARTRPVVFRPGLAGLLKRCPDATAVALAIEYTFWDERLPEILMKVGEDRRLDGAISPEELQQSLCNQLADAQDHLAALALNRNAGAFENLLSGSAGVGMIYDTGRRLSSWMHGRRFQAEHTRTQVAAPVDAAITNLVHEANAAKQAGLPRP